MPDTFAYCLDGVSNSTCKNSSSSIPKFAPTSPIFFVYLRLLIHMIRLVIGSWTFKINFCLSYLRILYSQPFIQVLWQAFYHLLNLLDSLQSHPSNSSSVFSYMNAKTVKLSVYREIKDWGIHCLCYEWFHSLVFLPSGLVCHLFLASFYPFSYQSNLSWRLSLVTVQKYISKHITS